MRPPIPVALALAALLLLAPSDSWALQVGLKAGYQVTSGGDYLSQRGVDRLDGLCREVFLDLSLLPLVSLEAGYGTQEADALSGDGLTSVDTSLSYALLTPKVHLPIPLDLDVYGGIGVGYHRLRAGLNGADPVTRTVAGVHAVAGVGYQPVPPLFLFVEGRYVTAVARDMDGEGRDFDLGGWRLLVGGAVAW